MDTPASIPSNGKGTLKNGRVYKSIVNKMYNGVLTKIECLHPYLAANLAAKGDDIARVRAKNTNKDRVEAKLYPNLVYKYMGTNNPMIELANPLTAEERYTWVNSLCG